MHPDERTRWQRTEDRRKEQRERLVMVKTMPKAMDDPTYRSMRGYAKRNNFELKSAIRSVRAFNLRVELRVVAIWRRPTT